MSQTKFSLRANDRDKAGLPITSLALSGIIVVLCAMVAVTNTVNAQGPTISSAEFLEAERLLQSLGYWVTVGDEDFDETARFALGSFQRMNNRPVTGRLTPHDLKLLRSAKRFTSKRSETFRIEIDTRKRILYRVNSNGDISHIIPVSIGSGRTFKHGNQTRRAETPLGKFSIRRQISGWRHSSFGELYYPNYFQGGLAIHGSRKMTLSSFTFGCIAVPMYAAEPLSRILFVGTQIVIK